MPADIRRLTLQGLQPVPYTAESLADAARHESSDGVYTVTNTYNTTQVLKLDAHLDRLEDSARRIDLPLNLDRLRLRQALRTMIEEAGYGDVRFRVTVERAQPDDFILTLEPFKPLSPQIISEGVRCVTVPGSRHNPAAKTTEWMHSRQQVEIPEGAYEALLYDEQGYILEGLSSNFYAVLDDELRTADEGVLPGIAQQIVFEIAPPVIPLNRQPVTVNDLVSISEAFITSSSRGIVPVVQINDHVIGAGTPGQVTRRLRQHYDTWVADHLEEL